MLRLSAMPMAVKGGMDRRVRRSLCDTCLKPPEIKRIVCEDCAREPTIKTMKSKKAKIGRRARLRCSAKGRPTPSITWSKGDVPIESEGSGAISIRTSGTTSILVFNRVSHANSGRYKCIATNDVGQAEEIVTLEVTRKSRHRTYTIESAPDRVPCRHNPCLNGGSCIYSPSLNLRRCLCTPDYEGVQCENLQSGNHTSDNEILTRVPAVAVTDSSRSIPGENRRREDPSIRNNVLRPEIRNPLARSTTTTATTSMSTSTSTTTTSTSEATKSTTVDTTTSTSLNPFPRRPLPIPSRTSFISGPRGQIDARYPLSRKSTLKIIPCREKNYCKNRGKCRYISKLKKKFCKCRSGFYGDRCEKTL